MDIALAQIVSGADPSANLRLIDTRAAEAAERGARLVLFPEASMRAFGHRLDDAAEPLDGPFAEGVRATARERDVTIGVGLFTPGELREDGIRAVRNTLLVTDGRGHESAYTKIHLFDAFGFHESRTVDAGEQPVVHTVDGVRLGLALCYDIRFPALFTHYGQRGCAATLVAASWGAGERKVDQWRLLAQARALDSTQFILACGQADPSQSGEAGADSVPGAPTGVGHSLAVAPDGRVLAEAGAAPELLIVSIDPAAVESTRTALPVLANAREITAGGPSA
jgi:predicted amidohydrolase